MAEPGGPVLAPILAFVGASGVGKTTLLCGLVERCVAEGRKVGVLKHSCRFDDPDRHGKDSSRLRAAGAAALVLGSPDATVAFWSHPGAEPSFEERLALLARDCEIVFVESYRSQVLPTVEVLRRGVEERPQFLGQERLVAIVSDVPIAAAGVPVFGHDQLEALLRFLLSKPVAGFVVD